jgi:hypothetical protein
MPFRELAAYREKLKARQEEDHENLKHTRKINSKKPPRQAKALDVRELTPEELASARDNQFYNLANCRQRFYHHDLHKTVPGILRANIPAEVWEHILFSRIYNPAVLELLCDGTFMHYATVFTKHQVLRDWRDEFKTAIVKMKWSKEDIANFIEKVEREISKWRVPNKDSMEIIKTNGLISALHLNSQVMAGKEAEYLHARFFVTFKQTVDDALSSDSKY